MPKKLKKVSEETPFLNENPLEIIKEFFRRFEKSKEETKEILEDIEGIVNNTLQEIKEFYEQDGQNNNIKILKKQDSEEGKIQVFNPHVMVETYLIHVFKPFEEAIRDSINYLETHQEEITNLNQAALAYQNKINEKIKNLIQDKVTDQSPLQKDKRKQELLELNPEKILRFFNEESDEKINPALPHFQTYVKSGEILDVTSQICEAYAKEEGKTLWMLYSKGIAKIPKRIRQSLT